MLKLYNSLSKKIEEFRPINPPQVGMYTCGPTVYDYPQIGNWRTYTTADLLYRILVYFDYKVSYTMNLTDVGHLSGDNQGDSSQGEDRMEKAERKENKTAWEIADFYANDFIDSLPKIHIIKPNVIAKATDHIKEQIALLQIIEKKGFAYTIDDGIYFDTKAYEKKGGVTGELTTLDQIIEGARIEPNLQKKDPRDFALWKFSPKNKKRHMEWDSPWGIGFPGWHLECSAMSMKYLGEQFDIHCGGEDIKATHHPNEILQSESATGKRPFVKYWIHGAFLKVDGGRMGKSLGNAYTLHDIIKKDYSPIDLRYLYLTAHYRKQLNFTWDSLKSARVARLGLVSAIASFISGKQATTHRTTLSEEKLAKVTDYQTRFNQALEDDLNLPVALSVVWETLKSNIPTEDKYDLVLGFDKVLGLNLKEEAESLIKESTSVPKEVKMLIKQREEYRASKDFKKSDEVRKEIQNLGYVVEDSDSGSVVKRINRK